MPFLKNYKQAMNLLNDIEKGKCSGTCKSTWIRNLKYALKTKTNPYEEDIKDKEYENFIPLPDLRSFSFNEKISNKKEIFESRYFENN